MELLVDIVVVGAMAPMSFPMWDRCGRTSLGLRKPPPGTDPQAPKFQKNFTSIHPHSLITVILCELGCIRLPSWDDDELSITLVHMLPCEGYFRHGNRKKKELRFGHFVRVILTGFGVWGIDPVMNRAWMAHPHFILQTVAYSVWSQTLGTFVVRAGGQVLIPNLDAFHSGNN
eukprot:6458585-Amphidinium_carterae.1